MMRIGFFLFVLFFSFSNAIATEFVEGMEDVPLAEGLQQITNDDFSFGNEETRLVEAYVTSKKLKL